MKYILSYLVVAEHLYNAYAPPNNTNWTIFHYVSLYIALTLIAITSMSKYRKAERCIYGALSLGWVILSVNELININAPYCDYITSVNTLQINTTFTTAIVVVLIIGYAKIWKRNG